MKNKILQSIFLAVSILLLSSAFFAQPSSTPTALTKTDLYEKFRSNIKGSAEQQKIAYEAGKEYLTKYGADQDVYTDYIKIWNAKYEKATLNFNFRKSLSEKKYADSFRYGKEILASEPDRLDVLLGLSWARNEDKSGVFDADTKAYALKAIKLIEAGKQPEVLDQTGNSVVNWDAFGGKENSLGVLNFTLGNFALKDKKPREAAQYFYATASRENAYSKDPAVYYNLAYAYQMGFHSEIVEETTKVNAKPQNTEEQAKAKLAELTALRQRSDKVVALITDALARAVALAADPKLASQKELWMKALMELYKTKENPTGAGLQEFIDKILSKPLPAPSF